MAPTAHGPGLSENTRYTTAYSSQPAIISALRPTTSLSFPAGIATSADMTLVPPKIRKMTKSGTCSSCDLISRNASAEFPSVKRIMMIIRNQNTPPSDPTRLTSGFGLASRAIGFGFTATPEPSFTHNHNTVTAPAAGATDSATSHQ